VIVIFDRQHYGKPGKSDLGAGVDLDGDGKVETAEMEANLTPLYYLPAKKLLEALGHNVYVFDNGWYSDRHNRANALAKANPNQRVAYLACHINAGRGDYAAFIHDARSRKGSTLANALADAYTKARITGIKRTLVREGTPDNAWNRGLNTIKGIYAGPSNITGVCLEPYFLDRQDHYWLSGDIGNEKIANALVAGLVKWATKA
jgi:hypothetical protein